MNKRLLFLNYLIWKPEDPGFSQKFEQLSRFFSGCILHLGNDQEVSAGKFRFCSTRYRPNVVLRQLAYLFHCLRKARKNKPFDVIISYDPLICGLAGVLVKQLMGAKLVLEVNTDHFWTMADGGHNTKKTIIELIKTLCMRLSFSFADGVKFINTPLAEKYSPKFNLAKKQIPIATFFSFIATDAFQKTGPNSDGHILFVGHPFNIKGVDVLIKAFNRISPDYPEVKLKIIGHCEDRGPYEQLADNNVNISFHKGMFFQDIVTEFEGCRFFVLPSRTESMGRVLVEAMACGKPVIGSRVGGIPEMIEENETGLLFESENDEELADKMRVLLDDPALEKRLSDAGYERAKKEFSPEKYAQTYYRFLESLFV
ncbi:MAG: glycosyltransferase family 4 protein [Proteobacteria bacterium]|nr:glycosyltransferase family 4 protein [bacterium]MBU4035655.1 glycosyltransferase family 4 protein [Pseudomonadota bacterium]